MSGLIFLQSRPRWTIRLAHDPEGKVPGRLQPPKMPSSYIVDRRGVIRQVNAIIAVPDGTSVILRCEKQLPADTTKRIEDEFAKLRIEIEMRKLTMGIPEVFARMRDQAHRVHHLGKASSGMPGGRHLLGTIARRNDRPDGGAAPKGRTSPAPLRGCPDDRR